MDAPLASATAPEPGRTLPTGGCRHHSNRAPWLRALVLGANDGLVSTAALMMGVGGGTTNLATLRLAGVAGMVGGALSMAVRLTGREHHACVFLPRNCPNTRRTIHAASLQCAWTIPETLLLTWG